MEISYEKAFNQIIDFLEKIEAQYKIRYYLVGGILVSIYSETRTTQDIDFVVDLNSAHYNIDSYIEILKQNKFFPIQDWTTAAILAKESNLLQFFDSQERIKLDNYIIDYQNPSKYKRIGPLALKKRVRENFLGIECWVASKEDYILSKLVFGGWQDYSDALGCWMRFQVDLDLTYLEKISKELGIYIEYLFLKSGIDDPDEYFKKINRY
ncbi:MAG: hypothetical protein EU532_05720 [Promethearchaeota archaeon]|nr:MAG: hypothetical protein EU532_05720 [Candidatus Lokiarchaeota archaeon]